MGFFMALSRCLVSFSDPGTLAASAWPNTEVLTVSEEVCIAVTISSVA
jgi:hypothetical protein